MRVAFVKPWNEWKRGEEIDVRWDIAMYLHKCGLVRWIDRPEKIATADLMTENAVATPAAETADARPVFTQGKVRKGGVGTPPRGRKPSAMPPGQRARKK